MSALVYGRGVVQRWEGTERCALGRSGISAHEVLVRDGVARLSTGRQIHGAGTYCLYRPSVT